MRSTARVRLGRQRSADSHGDMAFHPRAARRRYRAAAVDADGPGPFRTLAGDRPDAGQGGEDRLRPHARIRDRDDRHRRRHQDPRAGTAMRTATTIEVSDNARQTLDFVLEAERLGLDVCWVAEAWASDAPS